MPLLTHEQLDRLREIIQQASVALAVTTLGMEVSDEDLQRLVDEGFIDPSQLPAATGIRLPLTAFEAGRLLATLPASKGWTFEQLQAHLQAQPVAMTRQEQLAADFAQHRAGEAVVGLGARFVADAGQVALAVDHELEARLMSGIQTATAEALAKRQAVGRLKSELGRMSEDWARDWGRVASSESHQAHQQGFHAATVARAGDGVLMAKIPQPTACDDCKRLYLEDGKPMVRPASWWAEQPINNAGRKRSGLTPARGGVHPWCQCALVSVPVGMAFNDDWDLVSESEVEKSDRLERAGGGGPFIGPRGGKWADPAHKIHWEERPSRQEHPAADVPAVTPPPKWREQAQGLGLTKLPPKGTPDSEVRVDLSGDIHAHAVLTWRDSAGTLQRAYTAEFHRRNAAEKWTRVSRLQGRYAQVLAGIDARIGMAATTVEQDAAIVLAIIARTGLRPGTAVSAKRGHYGVTTLTAEHVAVADATVRFDFIGKSGQRNVASLTDDSIAAAVAARQRTGGNLFVATADDARDLLAEIAPDVRPKDFRTYLATTLAAAKLAEHRPPPPLPANKRAAGKLVRQIVANVSKEVARLLNNTAAVAKGSYIHPMVLDAWLDGVGAAVLLKAETTEDLAEDIEWYPYPSRWRALLEEDEPDLTKAEQPSGAGWEPVPHTKHGGYRRRYGTGWHYWYPMAAGKHGALEMRALRNEERGGDLQEIARIGGEYEVRHRAEDKPHYVAVLRDASHPGKVRTQQFDERGFRSHITHNSLADAIRNDLSRYTVVKPAPGIMDKLAAQPEWAEGMAHVAVVRAVNELQAAGQRKAHSAVVKYWYEHGAQKTAAVLSKLMPQLLGGVVSAELARSLAAAAGDPLTGEQRADMRKAQQLALFGGGWEPAPHSHKGAQRKRHGAKYEYRYPEEPRTVPGRGEALAGAMPSNVEPYETGKSWPTIGQTVADSAAAAFVLSEIADADRERFVVLSVDAKGKPLNVHVAHVGNIGGVNIDPLQVFKPAAMFGAAGIYVAHNHPSGDPQPSVEDGAITKRLLQVGRLLGVPVYGSIVLARNLTGEIVHNVIYQASIDLQPSKPPPSGGAVTVPEVEFRLHKQPGGLTVTQSAEAYAALVRHGPAPKQATLFMDSRGRVVATHVGVLDSPSEMFRQAVRHGANRVITWGAEQPFKKRVAEEMGLHLLDHIEPREGGNAYFSRMDANLLRSISLTTGSDPALPPPAAPMGSGRAMTPRQPPKSNLVDPVIEERKRDRKKLRRRVPLVDVRPLNPAGHQGYGQPVHSAPPEPIPEGWAATNRARLDAKAKARAAVARALGGIGGHAVAARDRAE